MASTDRPGHEYRTQFVADEKFVAARGAFAECLALEDFTDTAQNQEAAVYAGPDSLPEDVQRWMREPRVGARQLAKRIYQMIIRPGDAMESADVSDRVLVPPDAIFQNFPTISCTSDSPTSRTSYVAYAANRRRTCSKFKLAKRRRSGPSLTKSAASSSSRSDNRKL
ncbi:hypothetical protein [Actinoplanes sp. NPDC051411]|uniref:hypothetical protein n=1 Tax=Actinoplanes sp. NPDC051411 TaxID=3155522 RepID=UPI003442D7F8